MIKQVFSKLLNVLRNIGVIIFGLLGFSFTKSEKQNITKEENKNTLNNDDNNGGAVIPTSLPDENDSFNIKQVDKEKISIKNFKEKNNKRMLDTFEEENIIYYEELYELLGIKIYNDEALNIIVLDVFENSLLAQAGMEIGDKITKFNGESCIQMKTSDFIKLLEKNENEDKIFNLTRKEKEYKVVIPKLIKKEEPLENIKRSEVNLSGDGNNLPNLGSALSETSLFEEEMIAIEPLEQETIINEDIKQDISIDIAESALVSSIALQPVNSDSPKGEKRKESKKEIVAEKTNDLKEDVMVPLEKSEEDMEEKKDSKEEETQDAKKEDKKESAEKEAMMISKITDEDIKEKEEKIEKSTNEKKTLVELLKVDNRFKIGLLPFMLFKRRMVRNVYKAYLLNNSLVSARKLIGSYEARYQRLNYRNLLFHIRTTKTFENMTYDNLYNIGMLKIELQKKYGDELKKDPYLIQTMDIIEYLEARIVARHQRLIDKKRDLTNKKVKKLILTKDEKKA